MINASKQTFVEILMTDDAGGPAPIAESLTSTPQTTSDTMDTGERREMLGYVARHLITSKPAVGPGLDKSIAQTTVDGWYIYFDVKYSCYPGPGNFGYVHDVGFPVDITIRNRWPRSDGRMHEEQSRNEVIEISTADLDPTLFEVPEGFTKVERPRKRK
jgi:hypothetical protein